jgi:CHAT domain-containing protein
LLGGLSDAVQGYQPLAFVPQELEAIRKLQGGTVMLDKQFLTDRVGDKFLDEQFSIVHLASHGRFDRDAHKTFVLTHDSTMNLDDLERFIRPGQFRGRPVELVTLSACQTAAGDDRAALGMAGVAVKSGARSAVASLWFVNDQSSSELISTFYKNLWQEPGISKAQAMRKAQLSLLDTWTYRHPCYWAPYLVIGNWL